jgi:hypothetical protein
LPCARGYTGNFSMGLRIGEKRVQSFTRSVSLGTKQEPSSRRVNIPIIYKK